MARSWVEHVERQLNKIEKQRCSIEKPKLDSARKLRGVFYIDPDDMEFKDFMKKVEREAGSSTGIRHALQNP